MTSVEINRKSFSLDNNGITIMDDEHYSIFLDQDTVEQLLAFLHRHNFIVVV